jgi:ribosome modulation factor
MNDAFFAASQQQWLGFWTKAMTDQQHRAEALGEEWAKIQDKNIAQAGTVLDEIAKLTKESLAYQAQLGAEWRKLWMDGVKKATEPMTADKAKG